MTLDKFRAVHMDWILDEYCTESCQSENLIDVLTDAIHWCGLNGVDFDTVLRVARGRFAAGTQCRHPHQLPPGSPPAASDDGQRTTSDAVDIQTLLTERREIASIWTIDDVQALRPDLTDDQAWDVLQDVRKHLDAAVGINWMSLKSHADTLYPLFNQSITEEN